MKYTLVSAFFVLSLSVALQAQEGCSISLQLKEYVGDSLWLGRSFGRRAMPQFAIPKTAEGVYVLHLEKALPAGQYAVIYEPSPGAKKQYFTILLPEGHCQLEAEANIHAPGKPPVFTKSPENDLYYAYRQSIEALRQTRDNCNNDWRLFHDEPTFLKLEAAEKALADYQTLFINQHPASQVAKLAQAYRYVSPAAPNPSTGWEKRADFRYQWYRQHYFDGVDITSEAFWHSPEALDWLDLFVFKLSDPGPASAVWYAEEALRRLESNQTAYQYYYNYMLNSYEGMSRFYLDEVFLYLVRNEVEKGRTPWYSADEISEKSEKANRIERVLVGKKAPPVTLYSETEAPTALYDIAAPYTLLVFFQPDCSHCKKETLLIKRLYEKYRNTGLKVVMVCGKPEGALDQCWQYSKDYEFPADWMLLADGKSRSRFRNLFNLQTFPRLFLLDSEKNILYRRSGETTEPELEKVFSEQFVK